MSWKDTRGEIWRAGADGCVERWVLEDYVMSCGESPICPTLKPPRSPSSRTATHIALHVLCLLQRDLLHWSATHHLYWCPVAVETQVHKWWLKQQKCILSQIWGPDQVQNQGVSWAVLLPKLLGAESLVSSCRFWWLHVFPGLGLPRSGLCLFPPPPSCASLCVPGIRTPLLDLGPIWMVQDDLISRF